MEVNKPILSICIPTYNRSVYLEKSIASIIKTDEFKEGKIEIVISDNCSADNTEELAKHYISKHKNIKYYKNDKNVKDLNFSMALERGSGVFRKLSNDTIIYRDGSLKYMLDIIEKNIYDKPVIFFVDEDKKGDEINQYNDLDSFVKHLGRNITWIPVLGMWYEDIELLNVMKDNFETQLSQVFFAFEMFLKRKSAIIVNNFVYNEDERNRLRKALGIEDKIVIGHAGRFCEQKNHKFLIDVFKKIANLENNAVLLLIGAGETFERIKEQVREYGLEERVIFLGVRKDIASLYQAMDCFVFPSLSECLGIVAIEAQCSGLPVV